MPIEWGELTSIKPGDFTLQNGAKRLADKGDLFKGLLETEQNLDSILEKIK
jgi:DNA primase